MRKPYVFDNASSQLNCEEGAANGKSVRLQYHSHGVLLTVMCLMVVAT